MLAAGCVKEMSEREQAMSGKKTDPIRETDPEARALARKLIVGARYGALGVIEPGTQVPLVTRIAVGTDEAGAIVMLASDLSFHSKALAADPRCSVLVGEPGKGDPLAHPRLTVIGRMATLAQDDPVRGALRARWLEQHPKAQLYVDFPDFRFYRLAAERAHLNGGFGKAYVLDAANLANG